MLPTFVLVGRPNVGKSTLFNRLLRKSKAIAHDTAGVTRDRIIGRASHGGVEFGLVDTGGLVLGAKAHDQGFEVEILDQTRAAVEAAQALLLVVDGREGLSPLDAQAAEFARAANKPTLVLVNKVDAAELEAAATAEFHALGFELLPVSGAHGYNINALRERLAGLAIELAPPAGEEGPKPGPEEERALKLAVLGRPNAGKSSLVNALLGESRVIVSDMPGTTRDSVDVPFEAKGRRYLFVDTPGVRRKAHITDSLERFSVSRALSTSRKADVSVLVVDAVEGVTHQDKRLLAFLVEEKTAFFVAVNKIDLLPREGLAGLKRAVADTLRICSHAPVLYVSAKTGAGLNRLLPLAEALRRECRIRVGTGQLNRAMAQAIEGSQPPSVKGRRAKFYYLTQAEEPPPTFVFFVNDPALVKPSYARYLENRLREMFGIRRAPLSVVFRGSGRSGRKEGRG